MNALLLLDAPPLVQRSLSTVDPQSLRYEGNWTNYPTDGTRKKQKWRLQEQYANIGRSDLPGEEKTLCVWCVCILEDVLFAPIRVGRRAPGISIIHQWTSSLQGVIEYSCLWLSFELQQFSMPAHCYKNGPINLIRKRREREKRSWMEKGVWENANEAWLNEGDVYEWVCECACYMSFNKRVGRGWNRQLTPDAPGVHGKNDQMFNISSLNWVVQENNEQNLAVSCG